MSQNCCYLDPLSVLMLRGNSSYKVTVHGRFSLNLNMTCYVYKLTLESEIPCFFLNFSSLAIKGQYLLMICMSLAAEGANLVTEAAE